VHAGRPHRLDIHLRTLSTNEPHPKALVPILSAPVLNIEQRDISGNMLALLYDDIEACRTLEIWNWVEFPHKSVRSMLLFNSVDSLKEFNNLSPISVW
jgi:hypothetical protein